MWPDRVSNPGPLICESGALPTALRVPATDRRRGGKTILKSGQEWTLPVQLGQLKTGQGGKGSLLIHLCCPGDLLRLWDRTEWNRIC